MMVPKEQSRGLRNWPRQRGFTLLEVLVAVLILSLAYVAVLQNFSQSSANIFRLGKGRVTDIHDAMALEQQLREENPAGEVLVQGEKFVLKKIVIQDGQGETLKLEKCR
jgi:prepilin-type N-terminal cleavage/methylation domain-containing protein